MHHTPNQNNQQNHSDCNSTTWIGIDVSKSDLQSHCDEFKLPPVLANTKTGLSKLCELLADKPHVHIVFEATGGYEKPLLFALQSAGIKCSRVNPGQVRHFAKSQGLHAKTDAIDAQTLARFGATNKPEPTPIVDSKHEELDAAVAYRKRLQDEFKRESALLEHEQPKAITSMIRARLRSLKAAIAKVEKLIDELLASCEQLMAVVNKWTEVEGVGRVTAFSLLAAIPEIGSMSRNRVSALAGLAPFNHDSGKLRGTRSIYGGRRNARQAIYMAALVASRYNPTLKAFYAKLREKGKPAKVALTAVMRKLLILLNSIARNVLYNHEEQLPITA